MKRLLLILGLTVTALGCQHQEMPLPDRVAKGDVLLGGTLRVVEAVEPQSLAPEDLLSAMGQRIGNQVHCGLLRLDPVTLLPVAGIAERFETDSSGLSYVFHLRQGVLFHPDRCFERTNREVTAHDVSFSLHQLCRPESVVYESMLKGHVVGVENYHDAVTDVITGIRVMDDYTVQITLTRPDESFLFLLTQPSAAIISQKAYLDCDMSVVGAGPFIPQKERGEAGELILVRNPDYFALDIFDNNLPYLDTVTVSFIPSKELALERLLQGDLDLVTGVYLDPVRTLMENHVAEFTGTDARFMMQRSDDAATYEIYAVHTSRLIGFRENFLAHRDFSVLQLKH
ncbi:MAG: hypothetical protein K9J06_00735 [Flavobacteriales bacterium]|nr:hypothetical protein [Flavobacteriales bacterium]